MTMKTYHGIVKTPADAITLFNACLTNHLPSVRRRLRADEFQIIQSGSVFVWIEDEVDFQYWRDGKSWGCKKRSGIFYHWSERKPDGLSKKLLRTKTSNDRQLQLISYHSESQLESSKLQQPSKDPQLVDITHLAGITYPELILCDRNPMAVLKREPLRYSPYMAQQKPQDAPPQACPPVSFTPGTSRLSEGWGMNWPGSIGSASPFVYPQNQTDDGYSEPVQGSLIETLSRCTRFIIESLTNSRLDEAMQHLANGINTLSNMDCYDLNQPILNEISNNIAPIFQRFNIVQLCYYDKPDFPSLPSQYGFGPSNTQPKGSMDSAVLDALQYMRALKEPLMDSRLASNNPFISQKQRQICAFIDRWYETFLVSAEVSRDKELMYAETEMKCLTAKICILVCHFHDESIYDRFKMWFSRIVTLASSTLENRPDVPPTDYKLSFKTRCLPLLEFIILKCRWLHIRYQAWDIVRKIDKDQKDPILRVGIKIIEEEHNVKIEDVNRDYGRLFPLPAEEIRIKDYTADERFRGLVNIPGVNMHTPARFQVSHNQRLLLWCGSSELAELQWNGGVILELFAAKP
ncbi:cAMP-independent regulatory protein pac2 [Colletotrichum liriopes]|uniref:cAMP-independent regulatory protein pac2 n=1 Tax=Colletotrichum liriopes TaxID=708192 RepID=A0AA37GYT7_9PEZI|nr:cAMP-independent regulatory protein pac2 [Colletotrichum liriopes]